MTPLLLQVASVVALAGGQASTIVRNPAVETLRVGVTLHHATQTGSVVTLDREARALVAPATFVLAPGETQTVRIRMREHVPPGTTLRLRTCFVPEDAAAPAPGSDTAPVARIILQTCVVGKVLVQ